jgi:hypothetical protein
MDRRAVMMLENESWVMDGSEETNRALDEILAYQLTRLDHPDRAAATLKLLEAARSAAWYKDGLDAGEKIVIAGAFESLLKTQKTYRRASDGQPYYAFLSNYDWPTLLSLTLAGRIFDIHITSSGRQIAILATSTPGLEDRAYESVRIAKRHLGEIEKLAGELKADSVLIVVEPESTANERDVCGFAIQDISLTHISATCRYPENSLVHELVHLSTPFVFSTWFEEGTAYWVTLQVLGHPSDLALASIEMRSPGLAFPVGSDPKDVEDHRRQSDAGFAFYLELSEIIGSQSVAEHIRGIMEGSPGPQIIDSKWKATPPSKQTEVRALVERRCQGCRLPR